VYLDAETLLLNLTTKLDKNLEKPSKEESSNDMLYTTPTLVK
jgi:hypothetical protein